MLCNKLTKKTFFCGASLVIILLISTKLVLACQTIICDSGLESNICSIENNKIAAQWYFNFTLLIFIAICVLYVTRKRKGLFAVIFCFAALFLPPLSRYLHGDGNCDFFSTSFAKWLFYSSMLFFTLQITSWITYIKQPKLKIR